MSDGSSWWAVCLKDGNRFYVPMGEGENLRQVLMTAHEKSERYVETEDVSGAPIVMEIANVYCMFLSTPAIREKDHDPEGPLEGIRLWMQECSTKKWDEPL